MDGGNQEVPTFVGATSEGDKSLFDFLTSAQFLLFLRRLTPSSLFHMKGYVQAAFIGAEGSFLAGLGMLSLNRMDNMEPTPTSGADVEGAEAAAASERGRILTTKLRAALARHDEKKVKEGERQRGSSSVVQEERTEKKTEEVDVTKGIVIFTTLVKVTVRDGAGIIKTYDMTSSQEKQNASNLASLMGNRNLLEDLEECVDHAMDEYYSGP